MNEELHPFDELVRSADTEFRLAHAALLWARDLYSDVVPIQYLERLNALADKVDTSHAQTAAERAAAIQDVLVNASSFRGNYEDFANPANCYLNHVLDTRRGNPVTLGVIWLDVAEQLHWPFVGLAMPGHFLIRYEGVADEAIVDPFNRGQQVTREQCAQMLAAMFGNDLEPAEEHYQPLSPRGILARMLGNLYVLYANARDWDKTLPVLRRLSATQPHNAMVHGELGRVLVHVGELKEAATVLNRALEMAETDEDKSAINHHFFELRSKLNEQN